MISNDDPHHSWSFAYKDHMEKLRQIQHMELLSSPPRWQGHESSQWIVEECRMMNK